MTITFNAGNAGNADSFDGYRAAISEYTSGINLPSQSRAPTSKKSYPRATPRHRIPRRCSSTCRHGTIVKSRCRSSTANFPLTRDTGSR